MKFLLLSFAVFVATAFATVSPLQARTLNFMNSQGYQNQLAASRKAYADAVAAQSAPQPTHTARKKKKSVSQ